MKIKTFKTLAGYLENVPNIHNGGCGVSAYFIYEFFKEQGRNPEIVFLYDRYSSFFEENMKAIRGHDIPHAPGHVVIKVGDKVYDSSGEFDWNRGYPCAIYGHFQSTKHHIVSIDFLIRAIANRSTWNDDFDRKWIPKINQRTGIKLAA